MNKSRPQWQEYRISTTLLSCVNNKITVYQSWSSLTFGLSPQCHIDVVSRAPQTIVGFHGDSLDLLVPLKAVGGHQLDPLPYHSATWGLVLDYKSIHTVGVPWCQERLEKNRSTHLFLFYWFICQGQCILINMSVNMPELAQRLVFICCPWPSVSWQPKIFVFIYFTYTPKYDYIVSSVPEIAE